MVANRRTCTEGRACEEREQKGREMHAQGERNRTVLLLRPAQCLVALLLGVLPLLAKHALGVLRFSFQLEEGGRGKGGTAD